MIHREDSNNGAPEMKKKSGKSRSDHDLTHLGLQSVLTQQPRII